MFEKEAREYATTGFEKKLLTKEQIKVLQSGRYDGFQKGAEFGYNKANEWHKVSDKLPEMDVLVFVWHKIDDFPTVACRHIPYGKKEWVWDCKWGSGYTVSQSVGKDYLWKEIVLPEEIKENEKKKND